MIPLIFSSVTAPLAMVLVFTEPAASLVPEIGPVILASVIAPSAIALEFTEPVASFEPEIGPVMLASVTAPSAIFGVVTAPSMISAVFTFPAKPCTGNAHIAATTSHLPTLLPIPLLISFLLFCIMRFNDRTSHINRKRQKAAQSAWMLIRTA